MAIEGMGQMIEAKVGIAGAAFTHLVGIEAKGFVLGPILSLKWGIPFVPIRKQGKLPGDCWQQSYHTASGEACIQL